VNNFHDVLILLFFGKMINVPNEAIETFRKGLNHVFQVGVVHSAHDLTLNSSMNL